MINPDSELRFFSALQQSGETGESEQRNQKMIKDLMQGFRIICTAPDMDRIYAVTRCDTDLFEVEIGIDHLVALPPQSQLDLETFLYCDGKIARTTTLWPDGDYFDTWEVHVSTVTPLRQTFTPSNLHRERLGEQEFWRRYNASEVDPVATRDLLRNLTPKAGFKARGERVSWMSDAHR